MSFLRDITALRDASLDERRQWVTDHLTFVTFALALGLSAFFTILIGVPLLRPWRIVALLFGATFLATAVSTQVLWRQAERRGWDED